MLSSPFRMLRRSLPLASVNLIMADLLLKSEVWDLVTRIAECVERPLETTVTWLY